MIKRNSDFFAGLLFIVVGALIATQLSSIRISTIAMDSRMMPKICMILLFGLGGILVVKWGIEKLLSRKSEEEASDEKADRMGSLRVLLCLVIFGAFVALMHPIGFIAAGIIYLLLTFFVIVPDAVHKKGLYIIALLAPVAVYFLFTGAFHLILPTGTIW